MTISVIFDNYHPILPMQYGYVVFVFYKFSVCYPKCNNSKLRLMMRQSSGVLNNEEYPFIAITPRSTLTQNSCTCSSPIYGSNRSV